MRVDKRKHIKNSFSTLVCFSVMISSLAGFAYDINYPGGNNDFSVSGKTDNEMAGQIVTLKVEKGGEVCWIRQTETNRFGEYEFEFNVLEDSYGDISVSVNEGNGVGTAKNLYKSTPGEVERAVASVNSVGIRTAVSLTDSETNTAVHKILQVKAEDFTETGLITQYFANKTFNNLSELLAEYKKGEFLQELEKTASNKETLYLMMEECKIEESFSGNTAGVFASYSADDKQQILNDVKGNRFTSDDALKNAIYDAVIIKELSKVTTDNEKWAILEKNNDYLSLGLSTYENSSVFTSLKTQLFTNPITSISTLKTNIVSIYTTLTTTPPDGGNNGGNGGGGGGKREYPSASTDLVTPPESTTLFGFNDLVGYEWAQDAILSLAADGVINGKADSFFAPGDNVTRAEFAKIIMGAFDLVKDDTDITFSDVSPEHWSYSYIASAAHRGIVNGISDKEFNPDGKITRQDMATICYRVLSSLGINNASENAKIFNDDDEISEYAKEAVKVLSSLGIINGKGNARFAPKDFATRAEAAKIIHSLRSLS